MVNTSMLTVVPGMPLYRAMEKGLYEESTETEKLKEEREFLAGLDLPDCYFWALHPLDSVKIDGILREEKQQIDHNIWSKA